MSFNAYVYPHICIIIIIGVLVDLLCLCFVYLFIYLFIISICVYVWISSCVVRDVKKKQTNEMRKNEKENEFICNIFALMKNLRVFVVLVVWFLLFRVFTNTPLLLGPLCSVLCTTLNEIYYGKWNMEYVIYHILFLYLFTMSY